MKIQFFPPRSRAILLFKKKHDKDPFKISFLLDESLTRPSLERDTNRSYLKFYRFQCETTNNGNEEARVSDLS